MQMQHAFDHKQNNKGGLSDNAKFRDKGGVQPTEICINSSLSAKPCFICCSCRIGPFSHIGVG